MTAVHSHTDQGLTIRIAQAADRAALVRLAQLDSARPPAAARMLVAEVEDELVAAVPLEGRATIANPFRHTAGIVRLLEARVAQLTSAPRKASSRRRRLRRLGISGAGRAPRNLRQAASRAG